jgi:hypothetical protein
MEDSESMTTAGVASAASSLPPPKLAVKPEPNAHAAVLRSLSRVMRGLSALFWGLPSALIVCVRTATSEWLSPWMIAGSLSLNGLLLFGLWQIGSFQRQERPWRSALERAKLLALINIGLSPFLYFWNRIPGHFFFELMVNLMALTGLLFLFSLNHVLARLGAMLPDETLRHETTQFTALNRGMLVTLLLLTLFYLILRQANNLPPQLLELQQWLDRYNWLERGRLLVVMFFVLLPLSMTMALIWKTKEVILESAFGPKR